MTPHILKPIHTFWTMKNRIPRLTNWQNLLPRFITKKKTHTLFNYFYLLYIRYDHGKNCPRNESKGSTADILRQADGYFLTNTIPDLSQSDFKNRILLHTDLLAAESRENANYFSLEITGGASVHVDILRKQVDPFLKLELLREKMPQHHVPDTLSRGQSFRLQALSAECYPFCCP